MKDLLDYPEAGPSVEEASLARFIGPGREYYLRQWPRLQEGRSLPFHYWALLLGPLWLLYRQMFREAALYIGLFLLLSLLRYWGIGFWLYDNVFFCARALLLNLLLGFTANRLYLQHCKRQVEKVMEEYEKAEQPEILYEKGGVSVSPPIVFLLALTIWWISSRYDGDFGINTNFIF